MANIFGTDSAETLNALDGITNGADTIFGFGGADVIFGLGGNDFIQGGAGADDINGGSGTDTSSYTDSAAGVTVSLESGQGFGGTAEGDTLTSIENLTGSAHEDFLIGNAGNNVLTGLEDDDILKGGGGSDTLFGDSGSDTLKGGGGADILNGGSGVDTASYAESSAAVVVSLMTDIAGGGDAEGDELNSIENVTGSAHDDTLFGHDGGNVLRGNDGRDNLKGFGGNDTLLGGDGDDFLDGGAGQDIMTGGLGNDTYTIDGVSDQVNEQAGQGTDTVRTTFSMGLAGNLENLTLLDDDDLNAVGNAVANTITGNDGDNAIDGGAGADTLIGGEGNDAFIFGPGQAHGDTVVDFESNGAAAGDVLVFSGYGPGASFTQIDATHWQVNYNGGVSHDVITFLNGAGNAIHPSDYVFV